MPSDRKQYIYCYPRSRATICSIAVLASRERSPVRGVRSLREVTERRRRTPREPARGRRDEASGRGRIRVEPIAVAPKGARPELAKATCGCGGGNRAARSLARESAYGRRSALSGGDVPSPNPWRNLPVNSRTFVGLATGHLLPNDRNHDGSPARHSPLVTELAVGEGIEPPTFRLTAGRCTNSTTPHRRGQCTAQEPSDE
jgi:hypothetical protein